MILLSQASPQPRRLNGKLAVIHGTMVIILPSPHPQFQPILAFVQPFDPQSALKSNESGMSGHYSSWSLR